MDYIVNTELVLERMAELGIGSFAELAERATVHRNTIYPLMRGERSPFHETFLALCATLATDPKHAIRPAAGKDLAYLTTVANSCVEQFAPEFPTLAIFLFGSRASNSARKYSDYDLGITGGESAIPGVRFLRIKEFILERVDDLPVKVDVVNFDGAPSSFLLDFDSQLLPLAGQTQSISFLKGFIHATQQNTQTG